MAAEAVKSAPRPNVEVMVTPFPQQLPAIVAAGYAWDMGRGTRKVVTAEDADLLEAQAGRTFKNERSGKVESRARFSFARIKDTEALVAKKLDNRRGLAAVPPMLVPAEEQNKLLAENLAATQEHTKATLELLKVIASKK